MRVDTLSSTAIVNNISDSHAVVFGGSSITAASLRSTDAAEADHY
jgi:hypothetical protein